MLGTRGTTISMVARAGLRAAVALSLIAVTLTVAVGAQQAATARHFDQKTGRWSAPFTLTGDSVVLGYAFTQWQTPTVPESFFAHGDKPTVDQSFAPLVTLRPGKGQQDPWKALGRGLRVDHYLGDYGAEFYRDRQGVRLIALEGPHSACDTLILSTVSTHAASEHAGDFADLHTESSIRLGDSEARLLKRRGTPSQRDRIQDYALLWYLQKPKHVSAAAGGPGYDKGGAAAYVLKGDRIVEIWLHLWSNEPVG